MQTSNRFDPIDREQIAAQIVALMDAHFQRPNADEKCHILHLAERQIKDATSSFQKAGEVTR